MAALGGQPSSSGGQPPGGDNTFEWLLRAHAHVQHNDAVAAAQAQQAAAPGPEENNRSSAPGPAGPGA
eukprot:COSAG01_NODE_13960_length_1514_cov_1.061484_4_plen_68_part_00